MWINTSGGRLKVRCRNKYFKSSAVQVKGQSWRWIHSYFFAVGFRVPSVLNEAACSSSVIHFPQHSPHSFPLSTRAPCHSRHQNIDWFWLMSFYGCYSIRSVLAKSKRSLKFMRGDTHLSRFICLHPTIAWHVVFLMAGELPRSASTYWCGQWLSDDGRQRSSWVTSLHQAQEPTLKGNHFVRS